MLFLLLACQGTKESDSSVYDTSVVEETDAADTNNTSESACFDNTPSAPYVVYATPYDDNGNQASSWQLQPQNGERIDFEMGRATTGEVHLASDGSWGAVAQTDGSIGIFRYLDGVLTVVETGLTLNAGSESVYATQLWLDSDAGELWVTDQNWPNNGGGLFRATIDCETGAISSTERIFSSKNAYSVRPMGEHWLYLTREINEAPYQLSIFEDSGAILGQGRAFQDDDAIFSGLATDGTTILVGDNNEFSGNPTRVAHVTWDGTGFLNTNEFLVEDPVSIQIVDDWALIASGYGNELVQYQISRQQISSVVALPLPSVVLRQGEYMYAAGNTQIHKLEATNAGFVSMGDVVSLSGIDGIIGAIGVFGDF